MNNPHELTPEQSQSFNNGRNYERGRIISLIKPHLSVCNYFAVANEPCDVCAWVSDTIKAIKEN